MTRASLLPAAAAALLVSAVTLAQTSATGSFTPNLSNDTSIISHGWSDEELGQILASFKAKYRSQLGPVFSLSTHTLNASDIRISFPHDIHPRLLALLVYHLQYPPDMETRHDVAILARVTLTSAYPLPNPAYAGKVARVYVPVSGQHHDIVYFAVNGEFFAESLADGSAMVASEGRIPAGVQSLW